MKKISLVVLLALIVNIHSSPSNPQYNNEKDKKEHIEALRRKIYALNRKMLRLLSYHQDTLEVELEINSLQYAIHLLEKEKHSINPGIIMAMKNSIYWFIEDILNSPNDDLTEVFDQYRQNLDFSFAQEQYTKHSAFKGVELDTDRIMESVTNMFFQQAKNNGIRCLKQEEDIKQSLTTFSELLNTDNSDLLLQLDDSDLKESRYISTLNYRDYNASENIVVPENLFEPYGWF